MRTVLTCKNSKQHTRTPGPTPPPHPPTDEDDPHRHRPHAHHNDSNVASPPPKSNNSSTPTATAPPPPNSPTDTTHPKTKTAVRDLLIRHQVPRRHQPMTAADIDHAEHLYLTGHTLTTCATLTGFPASSINRALNKRGTPMRPAGRNRKDLK